ncbi:uncharacterized protein LOC118429875 isoform X1 [Branchiostoma floridae]|uniref:Uncharacterized protein LOC118429875 isoform X1 n=1 Tax=Branchiostoma floridae TaxID=7739 RepID=A0A9J7M8L8_BRAFL|nr:uncharacterized protein LOC118429875 isoform X1 [Branchiostoma floridae]
MAWDISRWNPFDRRFDTRTGLTIAAGCALGVAGYGLCRLVKNRAIVWDNVFGGQAYTTKLLIAFGAVGLISYGVWTSTPKDSSKRPAFKPREELCVVAADQHTLSTIAEEVREATAGIPQAYPVREHRVSNRRDVADLPLYRRSVCCVRNAERNISFNKHGEPEPDADLGFRAFHKMEESTGRSGVILVLFDHGQSQGISDLYSMEGINPSQRLLDAAKGPPCRFLTVSRKLNIEQKGFISRWAKP